MSPPSAPPAPGPGPPPPPWLRGELAWPLSLFVGFACTWAGLASGVPGLPALLAAAGLAPLWIGFQNRGEPLRAFVLALGGAVGIGGAVLGAVFEGGAHELFGVLPGARVLRGELAGLLGEAPAPGLGALLARHAGTLFLALAPARPTRGVAPLLAAALGVGGTAAAVGERALAAGLAGGHRLLALASAWPPGALAEAVAVLALGVLWSRTPRSAAPRLLAVTGGAFAALALAAWALAVPWGRLVGPTLGPGGPGG